MCGEKARERLQEAILERRRRARRLEAEIEARREEIAVREEELAMLEDSTEQDRDALRELAIDIGREAREPLPTAQTPPPAERKERVYVTEEAARDFMVERGQFTVPELCEHFDVSSVTARRLIEAQIDAKKAVKTDELAPPRGGKGRKSNVYRWTGKQGAADPTVRPNGGGDEPRGRRLGGAQVATNGIGKIANADVRKLVEEKRADGWQATRTGSGHVALRKEGVGMVSIGNTPSDHRAIKNARKQLEREERKAAELVPA